MKKTVSLVLALAMIIACFSMVTVSAADVVPADFNGVKFIAGQDDTFSFTRVDLGFTASDVVDGKVSKTYNVINPNDYEIEVNIHFQDGWNPISNVGESSNHKIQIPANSEQEVVVSQAVTDGNITYGETTAPIGQLTLRIDNTGALKTGDYFIVECPVGDPIENMQTNPAAWGGLSTVKATRADVPGAFNGVKFIAGQDDTFSFTRVDLGFTAADVVDGKVSKTYTVINPNDYEIEVNIHFQDGWNPISNVGESSNQKIQVAALSKVEVVISQAVTDGNITYGETTAPIGQLTLRIDNTGALKTGDYFIVECPFGDPIENMQTNPASWGGLSIAVAVDDELPEATPAPEATATTAPEATATPEATPTPVPVKQMVNGNAEDGMTGWGTIHGGTAALVQPGANGTGNAVQATISGTYHSIAFDLGPAIMVDKENGYDGAGAGKYTLSFYAKADAGKGGAFNVVINSAAHYNANQVTDIYPDAVGTYITVNPQIELTDEWQKFEVSFNVSPKYIDTLKALYNSSLGDAKKAYEIVLRLDGSLGCFAGGEYFNYCVDEVTLVAPEKTEENTKTPTGVTVEATAYNDGAFANFFKTSGNIVFASEAVDGEIIKTLVVRNDGEDTISLRLALQATVNVDGQDQWVGPSDGVFVTIEPGQVEELEFALYLEDNNKVYVGSEEVDLIDFFYRLDIQNEDGVSTTDVGTKFTIFATGKDYEAFASLDTGAGNWTTTTIYSAAPETTGDAAPVVIASLLVVAVVAFVAVTFKKREN